MGVILQMLGELPQQQDALFQRTDRAQQRVFRRLLALLQQGSGGVGMPSMATEAKDSPFPSAAAWIAVTRIVTLA